MHEINAKEALAKLESLCAKAEHSTGELQEKLRKWGIKAEDSAKIIKSLKDNRYVDDKRFARAYVNDKTMFSRWGKRKIAQGLYQKRVDREIITEALDAIDGSLYNENLVHLIKYRISTNPELTQSFEGRTKLYRYIVGRGYEPSLAAAQLKTVLQWLMHDFADQKSE